MDQQRAVRARALAAAMDAAAARHRSDHRLTQAEFGAMVADAEGRDRPYGQPTVDSWVRRGNLPAWSTVAAIEHVAGWPPGTLVAMLAADLPTPPPVLTVLDAIATDPALSAHDRETLSLLYHRMTDTAPRGRRPRSGPARP